MRIFDPHIHMTSRTTDDYRRMYDSGVRTVVEPAFWSGQPRTSPESFVDYFDSITQWEPYRASEFGIEHFSTIALNPKEANDTRCTPILSMLPRWLNRDRVVAVGEIGFDEMTPAEEHAFEAQAEMARDAGLPVLVHTPHRDKAVGVRRSLDLLAASGLSTESVLVDHLTELTYGLVVDSGAWMGFSIYPETKMDPVRMVAVLREHGLERILVNSAADWGRSNPLATSDVGHAMLAAGFSDDDVDQVLWRNPVEFFGRSGRLDLGGVAPTTVAGNSIERGSE